MINYMKSFISSTKALQHPVGWEPIASLTTLPYGDVAGVPGPPPDLFSFHPFLLVLFFHGPHLFFNFFSGGIVMDPDMSWLILVIFHFSQPL